jgi:hypothetical protein
MGKVFSPLYVIQTRFETHPVSYLMDIEAFSPEIKRLGREADHIPLTSANVKNTWTYTPTPPYVFMA